MNEYGTYSYEAYRKRIYDDIRIAENIKLMMLDEKRIEVYLVSSKSERRNLSENVTDEKILELMA